MEKIMEKKMGKKRKKLFYKNETMEDIYDRLVFFTELFVAIILCFGIYKITYKFLGENEVSTGTIVLMFISIIILSLVIVVNIERYKGNIPKLFLTFIIPIGIFYVVLLPPMFAPDEDGHLYKTYDVSRGNFITPLGDKNEGDMYVPKQLIIIKKDYDKKKLDYVKIHEYMQEETNYNELEKVQVITKTYSPVNYIVGTIIFFICRIFNIKIIIACYLIKLVNFMLFIITGYYSIKIIPFGKLLLAIYMFLPMILHQACSTSADAILNVFVILFISFSLKIMCQKEDLKISQEILYYLLIIGIAWCKYVYFPLSIMSLLLITNKNITKTKIVRLIIVSIIISIVVAGVWFIFSQKYVEMRSNVLIKKVNPMGQLNFILGHPIAYLKIFINTIALEWQNYLLTFGGSKLGWLEIFIPKAYIICMLVALFSIPFFEKNKESFEIWQRMIVIGIFLILVSLIITGLYITWTKVGLKYIDGVQGRYFIPVIILLLLTINNRRKKIDLSNIEIIYFSIFLLLNIIVSFYVYAYVMYF